MEIWISEFVSLDEAEVSIATYSSEYLALQATCADILDAISLLWDLNSQHYKENALIINDYIVVALYKEAIDSYNNVVGIDAAQDRYKVYSKIVHSASPTIKPLMFNDPVEVAAIELPVEAAPVVPGSTCRGPCGDFNPDAYPDQSNKTHVCYQCRMLSQVFGGTIK